MAVRGFAFLLLGLMLGGCVQSTLEPSSEASLTPRDKKLLASAPYAQAMIPEPYKRHIVNYHRKETPGTIVVDSDARYLYYVLPEGKAIRYGITVGEDALAFSGVAKVGRKEEWPSWTPTNDIKKRLGNIPAYVAPGPHNPMGARALYVYDGNKDTLYRIHGTNQPEYIGSAISSGCIRLTNEDVIDLFNRVKINSTVVVLAPGRATRRAIRGSPSRADATTEGGAGEDERRAKARRFPRRAHDRKWILVRIRSCARKSGLTPPAVARRLAQLSVRSSARVRWANISSISPR